MLVSPGHDCLGQSAKETEMGGEDVHISEQELPGIGRRFDLDVERLSATLPAKGGKR